LWSGLGALAPRVQLVISDAHRGVQDSDRRYLSEGSMALLNPPAPKVLEPKQTPPAKAARKAIGATA
jgi:hypothetical protein